MSIAYQVLGSGPPDLICVAGWLTHLDVMWSDAGYRHFVERLAGFARLILFDKRGVGLSDRLPPQTMPRTRPNV